MGLALRDTQLKVTKALSNGVGSVYTDSIDLGHGSNGDFLAQVELLISAPALTTGQLGDAATMKYDILHSDSPDLSSGASVLETAAITQTGAGGAGAVAATKQVRLPVDVKRYVGVKATNSASGNASAKSVTVELLA